MRPERTGELSCATIVEVSLPARAAVGTDRNNAALENPSDATTPLRKTRVMPDQSHTVLSASKYRQARRMVRRPKSGPGTSSNGTYDVPLLGPVYPLMS